jgi:hypothetical protein
MGSCLVLLSLAWNPVIWAFREDTDWTGASSQDAGKQGWYDHAYAYFGVHVLEKGFCEIGSALLQPTLVGLDAPVPRDQL